MYIRSITRYTKYNHVYTEYNLVYTDMYSYIPGQAHQHSNRQRQGELSLRGLQHVADPSAEVVDVLIQCMDWNIATRQSRIPEAELPELHNKAVALLDLLQRNLPDKTGEKGKWNFEKAHSILHKVREIILWGNSDNTSCQAPEVCTSV